MNSENANNAERARIILQQARAAWVERFDDGTDKTREKMQDFLADYDEGVKGFEERQAEDSSFAKIVLEMWDEYFFMDASSDNNTPLGDTSSGHETPLGDTMPFSDKTPSGTPSGNLLGFVSFVSSM